MLIDKQNLPLVSMDNMNEVHFEDVDIINDLSQLIDEYEKNSTKENFFKINEQYEKWYAHTVEHFRNEELMMEEKNFFAYPMHKFEHQNALNIMEEIFNSWKEQEDINILKEYIQKDLIQWLVNHIETMDTVTANFLKTGFTPCHAN